MDPNKLFVYEVAYVQFIKDGEPNEACSCWDVSFKKVMAFIDRNIDSSIGDEEHVSIILSNNKYSHLNSHIDLDEHDHHQIRNNNIIILRRVKLE
jgi:hypothetical protein